MVKTMLIILLTITITSVITIIILYFFALKNFFSFMKQERNNFIAEMSSNTKEVHDDVLSKMTISSENLLEEKEEICDGKEK